MKIIGFKHILIIFLFAGLILSWGIFTTHIYAAEPENQEEWYPFAFPEKLNENSPLNIGKLVLDAPAGNHGFLNTKEDGHLYFEDGTRAKFWGVNIAFESCFPSHEDAELVASKLAFFGCNAVRFHQIDLGFSPRGLFKNRNSTREFDLVQLDKFDFFVSELKKRGIYIYLGLHAGRLFTEKDGINKVLSLPKYAKYVSLFNRKIIDLQKEFAEQFLTHVNPFTGLSYSQDPVVIAVEITNENSLFSGWEKDIFTKLPTLYRNEFITLWHDWQVKNNIASPIDEIPSFQFRQVANETTVHNFIQFLADVESVFFNEMQTYLKNTLSTKAPIINTNNFLNLAELKVQASADIVDIHTYWDHPIFPNNPKNYTDAFNIKNISYVENYTYGPVADAARSAINGKPLFISEWNHCFPNDYSYELPIIFPPYANFQGWDGLFVFNYHTYGPFETTHIKDIFEIDTNSNKLALFPIGSLIFLNSLNQESLQTITFSYDTIDLLRFTNYYWYGHQFTTALSRVGMAVLKHGIRREFGPSNIKDISDDLFQKNNDVFLSDTGELAWHVAPNDNFVEINAKAYFAATGFIQNKVFNVPPFTITPHSNASLSLIPLDNIKILSSSNRMLFVLVGRCQNTGQEYNKDRTSLKSWGKAPVLLEKLRATLLCSETLQIFSLDQMGNRIKEIKGITSSEGKTTFTLEENTPWYEFIRE